MSCSTFSSLDSNTRLCAYFIVWMIYTPILKSPSPSVASLVWHSLYKLNRNGDRHHPYVQHTKIKYSFQENCFPCSFLDCIIWKSTEGWNYDFCKISLFQKLLLLERVKLLVLILSRFIALQAVTKLPHILHLYSPLLLLLLQTQWRIYGVAP